MPAGAVRQCVRQEQSTVFQFGQGGRKKHAPRGQWYPGSGGNMQVKARLKVPGSKKRILMASQVAEE